MGHAKKNVKNSPVAAKTVIESRFDMLFGALFHCPASASFSAARYCARK